MKWKSSKLKWSEVKWSEVKWSEVQRKEGVKIETLWEKFIWVIKWWEVKGWGESVSTICAEKNTSNYIEYFGDYLGDVYLLYMLYLKMSYVYCC